MRFANTAMVLKEPLLVTLTVAFIVAMVVLSGWIDFSVPGDLAGWAQLLLLLTVVCGVPAALLTWSHEVVFEPATKQVTERHRLLRYVISEKQRRFSDFTAVEVRPKLASESRAVTSPGSGGARVATETRQRVSYDLRLLRSDRSIITPDRVLAVTHSPLDLPMDKNDEALALEELARQLRKIGGWPAMRRDYIVISGTLAASGYVTKLQAGAHSAIDWPFPSSIGESRPRAGGAGEMPQATDAERTKDQFVRSEELECHRPFFSWLS